VTTMVKLLVFVATALTLAAAPALAAPSPELVAQVKTLVSGYERVPTVADWARVGRPEDVAAALMTLAAGDKVVLAARATSSLTHFPQGEVRRFLEGRVADEALRGTLRGKAAIALAGAFGDDAASVIVPLFTSPDPDVREDAIRAFARLASSSSERFLRARATREPAPRLAERMRATALEIAAERARREALPAGRPDRVVPSLPDLTDPGPVRP